MKSLVEFIYESKNIKRAKFAGITGAVLYKALIESIQHEWETDIKKGAEWKIDTYENKIKDVSGDEINSKASAIIAEYAVLWKENKENGKYGRSHSRYDYAIDNKWVEKDGQYIIKKEAIDLVEKLFKEVWDDAVITGSRGSEKNRWGTLHALNFNFGNGYELSTNMAFGSMKSLLKYATEKEY